MAEQLNNAGKFSVLERHVQTILVAVVTAILIWVGRSVSDSNDEIIRLQEQVVSLTNSIDSVKTVPDRVARLEVRVEILEQKLR